MTASLLVLISLMCGDIYKTEAKHLICIKQVSPCASSVSEDSDTSEADDVLTCLEKLK